jgi:hypothetical protein
MSSGTAFPVSTAASSSPRAIPNQTITVSDLDSTSVIPHTSSSVRVLAGPFARVLILAPGQVLAPGTEEGRTGNATDQSITYSFPLTVYSTDEWWNPVVGVSDLMRITCTDPMAELPPDTPLVDGEATMDIRLSTGGYQQITVTNLSQPLMPTSTTQVRAISSGLHLEAEVSPTTVQAGMPFMLTVRARNDAGSIIQEVNSTVTVDVENASTQEPGLGTLLTTQFQLLQGQRTVVETYTYAEPIVLIVSDDLGSVPAVSEVITVLPGDPANITLASDPEWVRGNRHATISARVADTFGNGVPDEEVIFEMVSGTGTLTPLDSLTLSDGTAYADYLSPRLPGFDRIRATSNGLIDEIEIETDVTLRIFTLSGNLVLRKDFPSGGPGGIVGVNEYKWDGRNGKGEPAASGGYILVIEARGMGETLHVMRHRLAVVR